MRIVVKIGTSSVTDDSGVIDVATIGKVAGEIAELRRRGHEVIVVSSGAVASGMPALGIAASQRPKDLTTLQALSAIGQAHLVHTWSEALGEHGIPVGQMLMTPLDFMVRAQYLKARGTLERLIELGVVPVVNENDAIADDELRFGDNDRIAALVAQLLAADLMVLLTDIAGLMDADPRSVDSASLIEEIVEIDHELEALAGGAGSARGSGGMASKLAAAKMASWSGVTAVIAAATRTDVLVDAAAGVTGVGTTVRSRSRRLPARKLWIAFALPAEGRIVVDDGAVRAITRNGSSLLAAGVVDVVGSFGVEEAVEIAGTDGTVVAKGLTGIGAAGLRAIAGRRSSELSEGEGEVINRDDLVVLPN